MEEAEHNESFDQEERRVLGFQELLHYCKQLSILFWMLSSDQRNQKSYFQAHMILKKDFFFCYLTSFLLFWQSQPDFICLMSESGILVF